MNETDVTIAGGGPVGLMLACELTLAGVRVQVLERLVEPDRTIKAGAINVPTVQALDRRGLLPAANTRPLPVVPEPEAGAPRRAGHFAAMMLDLALVDRADPDLADLGPLPTTVVLPQHELEELLAARAAELGVSVHRGVTVTGLEPHVDGVTVRTDRGPVATGWLVGCDGGRSVVRRLAGFSFPGTEAEITGRQAMVDIADAHLLAPGWNRTPTGVYAHGPVPGRILTVEFTGPPAERDAPVTLDELQASLRRVSGTDVTLTGVHTATRWTDNARQATTYRLGRVLLAGDAAHVHSPFGGQGLNLGIGDAMNLGWKLAATVHGRAPDGLLDTYTAERHPIGAWVLTWTRAQIALMRPDEKTDALREVVADLIGTEQGMTYVVKKVAGVTHAHPLPGQHPMIGRSAPDLAFSDGTRLAEHCHSGEALLVDLTAEQGGAALAARWAGRVRVVSGKAERHPGLAVLLVRPDGIVAWAADDVPDLEAVGQALRRTCGEPEPARAPRAR